MAGRQWAAAQPSPCLLEAQGEPGVDGVDGHHPQDAHHAQLQLGPAGGVGAMPGMRLGAACPGCAERGPLGVGHAGERPVNPGLCSGSPEPLLPALGKPSPVVVFQVHGNLPGGTRKPGGLAGQHATGGRVSIDRRHALRCCAVHRTVICTINSRKISTRQSRTSPGCAGRGLGWRNCQAVQGLSAVATRLGPPPRRWRQTPPG